MRIISTKKLKEFYENPKYTDSSECIKAWINEAKNIIWKTPHQVKALYTHASVLGNGKVIFNLCGNKYRLATSINYSTKIVYILFIGTHAQYDEHNFKN